MAFDRADAIREMFYEEIYIVSPPVGHIGKLLTVFCKSRRIGDRLIAVWIRVEIIIKMNPVDIVVTNYIEYHLNDVVTNFRNPGIEPFLATISEEPVRFPSGNVIRADIGLYQIKRSAIRVKPR